MSYIEIGLYEEVLIKVCNKRMRWSTKRYKMHVSWHKMSNITFHMVQTEHTVKSYKQKLK